MALQITCCNACIVSGYCQALRAKEVYVINKFKHTYTMSADDLFWCNGIELRANKQVWHRFKVNRYEMNVLCAVTTYLTIKGRKCVSTAVLFNWLGVADGWKKKAAGYVQGLHSKGLVHKMNYRQQAKQPGNSLAITEYGLRVLEFYFESVKHLEKERKRGNTYKNLAVHSANIARDLPTYILVSAGRDN